MTLILDGRKVRDERREALKKEISEIGADLKLAIIQVGSRPDSNAYIEQKKKFGGELGVSVKVFNFPEDVEQADLFKEIVHIGEKEGVTGVIIQLPLPEGLDPFSLIEAIKPKSDVDGLTAFNYKKLMTGEGGLVPATAKGVETLLDHYNIEIEGKEAVVVGRSMLVGTPISRVLLNRGATVTVCHKGTKDLVSHTKKADILVVATGVAGLITEEHVNPDQVVVDVGINLVTGKSLNEEVPGKKFVGDVDFEGIKDKVKAISSVPGGVGPMTVLSLFENLFLAHKMQNYQESV